MEKTFAALSEIASDHKGEGNVGTTPQTNRCGRLNKILPAAGRLDKINRAGNHRETDQRRGDGNNLTRAERHQPLREQAEQVSHLSQLPREYLFDGGDGKSYIDVKIQPTEESSTFWVSSPTPRGKRTTTDTTVDG